MRVVITAAAKADLLTIPRSIAHNNPTRAVSFTEELLDRCQALADKPRTYHLVPRYRSFGIRRCVHGDDLFFYRLQPEQIEVIHILQGARDIEALLLGPPEPPPGGLQGFTDQNPLLELDSGGQERFGAGLGWCLLGRAGLGRKAQPFDGGAQCFFFGVQLPELGNLLPQLLGFFPDLLAVVPHPQDFALDLLRSLFAPLDRDPIFVHPLLVLHLPLLVLHLSLLVAGIPTPIEHRQKLSPPRQR